MSENFVTVGQGIPNTKSFWDKLIRMVNAESGTVTTPTPQPRKPSQTVVQMINRTGRTLNPGDWCEIDDEKFTNDEDKFFANPPTFTGVVITDNESTRRLACAMRSIRKDGTGDAVVFGVCQTRVMMIDPEHQYAQAASGEPSHLESTGDITPYRIMADPTGAATTTGSAVPRSVLIGSAGGETRDVNIETPDYHDANAFSTNRCSTGVRGQMARVGPNFDFLIGDDDFELRTFSGEFAADNYSQNDEVCFFLESDRNDTSTIKTGHDGIVPARLLQLHGNHNYAFPAHHRYRNGESEPNTRGFLVSAPFGPFKILNRRLMPGQAGVTTSDNVGYYDCIVKFQNIDRQDALYTCRNARRDSASGEWDVVLNPETSFTEISVSRTGRPRVRKSAIIRNAPSIMYLVDVDLTVGFRAIAPTATHMIETTADGRPSSLRVNDFPAGSLTLNRVSSVAGGGQFEESRSVNYPTRVCTGNYDSDIRFTHSFLWLPQQTDFRISLTDGQNETIFGNTANGTVRLRRLGERNAGTHSARAHFNWPDFNAPRPPSHIHVEDGNCPTLDYASGFSALSVGNEVSRSPTITPGGDFPRYTLHPASTLPPGLVLDAGSGAIFGTPSEAGTGVAIVSAHHAQSNLVARKRIDWTVR